MITTFQKIPPEEIDNLPAQAIKYLQDAVKRSPSRVSSLELTLDIAKRGYGNLYLVYREKLIGACYILVCPAPDGKIVAPDLVGGDDMKIWNADFHQFLFEFGQLIGAVKVSWIGRKGWSKAYPKSKIIGYIYEHALEGYVD